MTPIQLKTAKLLPILCADVVTKVTVTGSGSTTGSPAAGCSPLHVMHPYLEHRLHVPTLGRSPVRGAPGDRRSYRDLDCPLLLYLSINAMAGLWSSLFPTNSDCRNLNWNAPSNHPTSSDQQYLPMEMDAAPHLLCR